MKDWIIQLSSKAEGPLQKISVDVSDAATQVKKFINKMPGGVSDSDRGIDFIGGFLEQLREMGDLSFSDEELPKLSKAVYRQIVGRLDTTASTEGTDPYISRSLVSIKDKVNKWAEEGISREDMIEKLSMYTEPLTTESLGKIVDKILRNEV